MKYLFLILIAFILSMPDGNAQFTNRYGYGSRYGSSSMSNPMGHSRVQDRINSHRSHRTHGFSSNSTFENNRGGMSNRHGFNTNRQSAFNRGSGYVSHSHHGGNKETSAIGSHGSYGSSGQSSRSSDRSSTHSGASSNQSNYSSRSRHGSYHTRSPAGTRH